MIINPSAVTNKELRMNGKKPNCPDEGCHADEKSSCPMDPILKIGEALIIRPRTIRRGSNKTRNRHAKVQAPAEYSFIFRIAIINY
jgi:hypothetical protein